MSAALACTHVLKPGLLSTIQDAGREGWRALGVGAAGAADRSAYLLGQYLLGESTPWPAALELSLGGPQLLFDAPARIVLTGAPIDARCDGQPLPWGCVIDLPARSTLTCGRMPAGCRSYLGIAGGWQLDPLLGSRSTDLRAGFGGLDGRALKSGDRLPYRPIDTDIARPRIHPRSLSARWCPQREEETELRFLPEPGHPPQTSALQAGHWQIGADSNRHGLRLLGTALQTAHGGQAISAPVLPGAIQLPPSGQPIILGVDAQTVGGYPILGWIIAADLDRLAQLAPGAGLHLHAVDRRAAEVASRRRQTALARCRIAIEAHAAAHD